MTYEELKAKHPDWNWDEAEEIFETHPDDIDAGAEYFDRLVKTKKKDDSTRDKNQRDLPAL